MINLIFFLPTFDYGGAGNSVVRLCKKLSKKKQFPKIFSSQIKVVNGNVNNVSHCNLDKLISWEIKNNDLITHDCSLEKIRRGLDLFTK